MSDSDDGPPPLTSGSSGNEGEKAQPPLTETSESSGDEPLVMLIAAGIVAKAKAKAKDKGDKTKATDKGDKTKATGKDKDRVIFKDKATYKDKCKGKDKSDKDNANG